MQTAPVESSGSAEQHILPPALLLQYLMRPQTYIAEIVHRTVYHRTVNHSAGLLLQYTFVQLQMNRMHLATIISYIAFTLTEYIFR